MKKPAIFFKNFGKNKFTIKIIAKVNTKRYYEDVPILVNNISNPIEDLINNTPLENLNKNISEINKEILQENELINNPNFNSGLLPKVLELMENTGSVRSGTSDLFNKIKEKGYNVKNNTNVTFPDEDELDIPPRYADFDVVKINDSIVSSINVDTNTREKKAPDDKYTSQFNIISDNTVEITPTENTDYTILTLSDGYVKKKLWVAKDNIPAAIDEFHNDIDDILSPVVDNITNEIERETEYNIFDPKNEDEILKYYENLYSEIDIPHSSEQWYGIPILELAVEPEDISQSIILQIDTKNNWYLNILNLGSYLYGLDRLQIDKTIPPDTKFMVVFKTTGFMHTIQLKIDGDPNLYSKTVAFEQELTLTTLGADYNLVKTFCGIVYDNIIEPVIPIPDIPPPPEVIPVDPIITIDDNENTNDEKTIIDLIDVDLKTITKMTCNDISILSSWTIMFYGKFKYLLDSYQIILKANNIRIFLLNNQIILENNNISKRALWVPHVNVTYQFSLSYSSDLKTLNFQIINSVNNQIYEFFIKIFETFEIDYLLGEIDPYTKSTINKIPIKFSNLNVYNEYFDFSKTMELYQKNKEYINKYIKLIL